MTVVAGTTDIGFMVESSIPGVEGRHGANGRPPLNSIEAFPNYLDKDGGIWSDDEDISYRGDSCISMFINGLGAFTTAEAREFVASLTTLIERLEAINRQS